LAVLGLHGGWPTANERGAMEGYCDVSTRLVEDGHVSRTTATRLPLAAVVNSAMHLLSLGLNISCSKPERLS
jgi:hypothetical protein